VRLRPFSLPLLKNVPPPEKCVEPPFDQLNIQVRIRGQDQVCGSKRKDLGPGPLTSLGSLSIEFFVFDLPRVVDPTVGFRVRKMAV